MYEQQIVHDALKYCAEKYGCSGLKTIVIEREGRIYIPKEKLWGGSVVVECENGKVKFPLDCILEYLKQVNVHGEVEDAWDRYAFLFQGSDKLAEFYSHAQRVYDEIREMYRNAKHPDDYCALVDYMNEKFKELAEEWRAIPLPEYEKEKYKEIPKDIAEIYDVARRECVAGSLALERAKRTGLGWSRMREYLDEDWKRTVQRVEGFAEYDAWIAKLKECMGECSFVRDEYSADKHTVHEKHVYRCKDYMVEFEIHYEKGVYTVNIRVDGKDYPYTTNSRWDALDKLCSVIEEVENEKIAGATLEERVREFGKYIRANTSGTAGVRRWVGEEPYTEMLNRLKKLVKQWFKIENMSDEEIEKKWMFVRYNVNGEILAEEQRKYEDLHGFLDWLYNTAANGWDLVEVLREWKIAPREYVVYGTPFFDVWKKGTVYHVLFFETPPAKMLEELRALGCECNNEKCVCRAPEYELIKAVRKYHYFGMKKKIDVGELVEKIKEFEFRWKTSVGEKSMGKMMKEIIGCTHVSCDLKSCTCDMDGYHLVRIPSYMQYTGEGMKLIHEEGGVKWYLVGDAP